MVSTVTLSTVSTTTAITGSLAIIVVLVLIVLLIQKELATAAEGSRFQRLGKALNIGIAPLLIAFILIFIFQVIEVLK